jgi:glucan phosphorylase
MLSEALPIYSGEFGNLADNHLKAASNLGVPVDRSWTALSTRLFSSIN